VPLGSQSPPSTQFPPKNHHIKPPLSAVGTLVNPEDTQENAQRPLKSRLEWQHSNLRPLRPLLPGKSKEIRAWTDAEMAAFEKRWPYGTKQRAAYEPMLNVGTARIDTHLTTGLKLTPVISNTRAAKPAFRSWSKSR
jgi:hypothetical protein